MFSKLLLFILLKLKCHIIFSIIFFVLNRLHILREKINQLNKKIGMNSTSTTATISTMTTTNTTSAQQQQAIRHHHHLNSNSNNHKSWAELKTVVNDLRRQLMSLSTMVPMNIKFRSLSDGRTRIYYLSTPPSGWETTLLYTDVQPPSISSSSHQQQQSSTSSISSSSLSTPSLSSSSSSSASSSASPASTTSQMDDDKNELRKRLQWRFLLDPTIPMSTSNNNSREIQLLLERKRLSTWGITSYELHPTSGKIVFPCASTLYQCIDTGYNISALFPSELRISQSWAALEPQICPHNSDVIAYVSGGDIWVTHTFVGQAERLTFVHDGRRSFTEDPFSAGVPSYVMQEEFGRYQGYWWQPNSKDGVYRIVYEEVDESEVCLFTFPSSLSVGGEFEEYRFPRAGTPNAKSKLKLIEFVLSESLEFTKINIKDLQYPLSYFFPWCEYIVRVGWTPDSEYIWTQLMNRSQQRLDLMLIHVDNFCEPVIGSGGGDSGVGGCNSNSGGGSGSISGRISSNMDHSWKSPLDKSTTPIQVIYSQISTNWINVTDILHFLEITDCHVKFIWASEESGYRHLYVVKSSLERQQTVNGGVNGGGGGGVRGSGRGGVRVDDDDDDDDDGGGGGGGGGGGDGVDTSGVTMNDLSPGSCISDDDIDTVNCLHLTPRIIEKIALSSGEWEVLGRNIWVDNSRKLVYFLGLRETPLEKHLYVVSLINNIGQVRLLTEPGNSYSVEFNKDCTMLIQNYCNIRRLPSCEVFHITQTCDGGSINGLQLLSLGYLLEGGLPDNPQYCPSIYNHRLSSGDNLYAMVFKPHNFTLGVRYPTVLCVYGGPEVQTVNNTFKGMRHLRMHMLAAQGYCVVCIDSRGSRHRGVRFENHIRCKMGQVEINDQVEVLNILGHDLGYIDMERIAIHGWSYGGYLSLMGLIQYPDIFKLAIAGAPVTNWEYYDTGYTERYMDLPENNRRGYAAGSVLNYVNQFPEEDNRLLLIHGLIDENVHFFHTSQLINLLIKYNKPYQLQVYPNERHSLRNLEAGKHYETTLLSFLQKNL